MSQVTHLGVKCLAQRRNNETILRGDKHDISLKILDVAGFEPAQQAAILAKHRALTVHIMQTLWEMTNQ